MKKIIAIILCIAMLATFTACGNKAKNEFGVDTIKIGFVGALTGPSATMGQANMQGAQMAIDEINAAGGVNGIKLELVTRDDEADPTKNFTYVEELIYKEGVHMLIGAPNSACAAASMETVTENKIPTFLATATSSAIVDPVKYPYTFRVTGTNDIQAEALVKMAVDGGYESVVVVGDTTALGIDGFASTEKYAEQYGLEVVEYISYTAGDADLSAVANSIKNADADLVLSWMLFGDAAKVIRSLDRVGYMDSCEIIGYTGTYSHEFTALLEGIDMSNISYLNYTPWTIGAGEDRLSGKTAVSYAKFSETYGEYTVDGSGRTSGYGDAIRAYEAVYLYCAMVEKAGSIEGDAVKTALETYGKDYETVGFEWVGGYAFTAEDHEGYSADMMCRCVCKENIVNEYLQGDMPERME